MKKLIGIFLTMMFILAMSGCSKDDKTNKDNEKITQELEYIGTQIINILNSLNNISLLNYKIEEKKINLSEGSNKASSSQQESSTAEKSAITIMKLDTETVLISDNNNIDWENIKNNAEELNSTWQIIMLDLYNLNIKNDEILAFSTTLNNCQVSLMEENKQDSLNNFAILYSYIPYYLQAISAENSIQNKKQVESYVLQAYSYVNSNNWGEVSSNINQAETYLNNLMNDIQYSAKNEYKLNKAYVEFKELQNSIINANQKIFYIKYKNLMKTIRTL